jgi:hypothetical protein
MRYLGFVGSALVLLLIGIGWFFPQPVPESIRGDAERPTIRISSVEQLPELVVIDTSLPTIVPPPIVLEFAERWPQETVADVAPLSKPVTPTPVSEVSKKQNLAKREPSKKVAVHRAAPKVNIESPTNDKVPAAPAVTRLSLLDILKEGLGQTQAKLIASLEPLTAYISKPRPETR